MFSVSFALIIICSLFVLWKMPVKEHAVPWRWIVLFAVPGALVLFPLSYVLSVEGFCFNDARAILRNAGVFCLMFAALCLSLQALNSILWYGAEHQSNWNQRQKWGVAGLIALVLALVWMRTGTATCWDFEHCQYPQILSGHYGVTHTLTHTLFCEGILGIWHHIHAIVLVQLLLFLFVLLMMLSWGIREKIPACIVFAAILFSIYQFNLVTTVIKDTPYAISVMTLTLGLCMEMLETGKSSLWMIALGLAGMGCFRYDGSVPFFLTIAVLACCMLRQKEVRCRLWIPLSAALACWLFASAVLPEALHADQQRTGTRYAKMAHVICDVVAEGGHVSEQDMGLIEREIMPREMILERYHHFHDSLHPVVSTARGEKYLWSGLFPSLEIGARYSFNTTLTDKGEMITRLFFSVAVDNPLKAAKILLLNSQMVWNMSPNACVRRSPQLCLYYGCFITLLLVCMFRRWKYLIPFVPFYGTVLVIGAVATTYEIRYLLPVIMTLPILFLYAIACIRRRRTICDADTV